MRFDISNKKVVVWGTGLDGVKTIYKLENEGIDIAYLLNTGCKVKSMKTYKVYEPGMETVQDAFIIVASTYSTYSNISNKLSEWGLEEFDDYIYYDWLGKKLVLLHGNCYMEYVKEVLLHSDSFTNKYALYPNKLVYDNIDGEISQKALENIDIFLHQNISEQNLFSYKLSDAYIMQFIRKDSKEIVFPNFVGLVCGMYPQYRVQDKNYINEAIKNGEDTNGMFPHVDIIASKAIVENSDLEEMVIYCNSDSVLPRENIEMCFEAWINKIEEREKRWSIKILDFILNNYKDMQLFYDIIHPNEVVFAEIFDQLFDLLEIEKPKRYIDSVFMDVHEIPVYPYVKKVLGMKWSKEFIRNGTYAKRLTDKMDLKEYIKGYAWWCFGKKL